MPIKKSTGLSIDDLYKLIHNPDDFKLTENNMSQLYILMLNLNHIFNSSNH